MKFTLTTQTLTKIKTDCLVLPVTAAVPLTSNAKSINAEANNLIAVIKESGDLNGQLGQSILLPTPGELAAKRLLLVNAGTNKKLPIESFKQLLKGIFKAIKATNSTTCTIVLDELSVNGHDKNWLLQQAILVLGDAAYQFTDYKTNSTPLKLVEINFTTSKALQRKQQQTVKDAQALVAGINFTKNLGNTPCNIATPSYLVKQAKELAKNHDKLSIKVLNEPDLKCLNMNTILAVGQGSAQSSHLIELQYKGTNIKKAPIVLVGKGVTFDTGGISIKAATSMEDLKYDMCGAATVLGVIHAIAALRLPVNVIGLVPTVENMPGGNSFKPGDVIKSMSGQTVEIINTDAEGRLILCDALTYAKQFKPQTIIDMATLTGAMMVSLGSVNTGFFTHHDKLAKNIETAANNSADKAWRMPLDTAYQKGIDSKVADMKTVVREKLAPLLLLVSLSVSWIKNNRGHILMLPALQHNAAMP